MEARAGLLLSGHSFVSILLLGLLAGCTTASPPAPAVGICRQHESALIGTDADVRSVRQYPLEDWGKSAIVTSTCFVTNDSLAPPNLVQTPIEGIFGKFTRAGELFNVGGNEAKTAQQNNGNPAWQVPLASQDPIDGRHLPSLGHRTVVQVTAPNCDAGQRICGKKAITRSWVRGTSPAANEPLQAPAERGPHCLGPAVQTSAGELSARDLHILVDPQSGQASFSACAADSRAHYFSGVNLTIYALFQKGQPIPVSGGNTVDWITPLRDSTWTDPKTVVLLGTDLLSPDLRGIALDQKAKVQLTYIRCAGTDFQDCRQWKQFSTIVHATIDAITPASAAK